MRSWPKRKRLARLGLGTLMMALLPVPIGTQDLSAHVLPPGSFADPLPPLVAPFAALHHVKYRLPRPLGTAMPLPDERQVASLGRVSKRSRAGDRPSAGPPRVVIRAVSGDDDVWPQLGSSARPTALSGRVTTARLYFGSDVLHAPADPLLPPADDAGLVVPTALPQHDDARHAAVPLPLPRSNAVQKAASKSQRAKRHLRSPVQRLSLTGKKRTRAEKCLADAVYFEARGEPVRGQIAVGQVVMNRVFSDYYPDNVCDVVYQNADRRFGCQFTFACDGIPEVVTEPEAWRRARRIAKDILDGKLWLKAIGWATHYHADWVHPSWVHEMNKLSTLGVHTFYRPRAWGSGADEPAWGNATTTAALVSKL